MHIIRFARLLPCFIWVDSSIEVSEQQLRRYGISFDQIAGAIRKSSINLHGGTIRTQGEEIRSRTVGRKYTGADLADIVILAGTSGELITLYKIATIHDGFTEDPINEIKGVRVKLNISWFQHNTLQFNFTLILIISEL